MADSIDTLESATFDAADVACLYQPIIRLHDGMPVAAEVLARRRDESGTLLGPETFESALYDGESARRLTRFVVKAIIADITAGHLQAIPLIFAVNLPLDVLMLPDLLERIEHFRAHVDIDPSGISFELTETRPIRDFAKAAAIIASLRRRGYRVALDDVSPATESLDALFKLPFSAVKLDRSVIQLLDRDASAGSFVREIVRRAKKLRCNLIAEGIEESSTLDTLLSLGVGYGQGFVLAKPMPGAALRPWLADWHASAAEAQAEPELAVHHSI